jgi:hypothetical protein
MVGALQVPSVAEFFCGVLKRLCEAAKLVFRLRRGESPAFSLRPQRVLQFWRC